MPTDLHVILCPTPPGGVTQLHSSCGCLLGLNVWRHVAQDQLCVQSGIEQPVLLAKCTHVACRPASPMMTFSPLMLTTAAEAMVTAMALPCHLASAPECQESSPAMAAAQLPPPAAQSAVMQLNWQCSGRRAHNRPTRHRSRQWQHPRPMQQPRGLSGQGRRRQTSPHRDALCHPSRRCRAWSVRRSC